MSREAVPHLKKQGGGRIINILAARSISDSHLRCRRDRMAWWRSQEPGGRGRADGILVTTSARSI